MKELEIITKENIEVSVTQKKQVEHLFVGKIVPFEGHKIWKINVKTLEVEEAKYTNATYHLFSEHKKEIIIENGFDYVSALNKENAIKKHKKGLNGSRPITNNPMSIF